MYKAIFVGIFMAIMVAACGGDAAEDAPATIDSITSEFCEEIVEILKKPADQWDDAVQTLGEGLDKDVVAAGLDEEELGDNIREVCGDDMAKAASGT